MTKITENNRLSKVPIERSPTRPANSALETIKQAA